MALKDILVHLDGRPGQERRLGLAIALARRCSGALTGLHASEPPPLLGAAGSTDIAMGGFPDPEIMRAALTRERLRMDGEAAANEALFRGALANTGIAASWQVIEGEVAELVTRHARYFDLVVLGQIDPEDPPPGSNADLPEAVLIGAGRPVLMVPYVGDFPSVGLRVLIAWDGSREAARAVGDALPLLREAEAVTVLSVDPSEGISEGGGEPGADLVAHLRRHGIAAEAKTAMAAEVSVADLILSSAADRSADLLVMGAYGHSPTRELILGGATRSILRQMTLPVLFSH